MTAWIILSAISGLFLGYIGHKAKSRHDKVFGKASLSFATHTIHDRNGTKIAEIIIKAPGMLAIHFISGPKAGTLVTYDAEKVISDYYAAHLDPKAEFNKLLEKISSEPPVIQPPKGATILQFPPKGSK